MALKLPRRAMLRGLGGVAIGLPFLEAMFDALPARAQAAPVPKRFLVCFDGQSLGADFDPLANEYVPNTVGANYDLKTALAPFATYNNVQNEISVISGLAIPTAHANGGVVPAGGRVDGFHVNSLSPLLSGVRSDGSATQAFGPTSDQLVANAIAGNTTFKSLVYRVQAEWYLSVSAPYGRDMISYTTDSAGKPLAIPPTVSPQQAFKDLFGNFTGGLTAAQVAALQFQQRTRKSVLDLVMQNGKALMGQLGHPDQVRLQVHFDAIRDLENQVAALPPPTVGACQNPGDPGPDPALGGAQGYSGGNNTYSPNLGYSGEDQRAKVFCDLIHMAFACDLTRVASLQITMFQSHMNMYPITGQMFDVHELGHSTSSTHEVSKAIAWHMKHFGYLIAKFRDTPEGSGAMLDNIAAVMLHEGGHGFDPASGNQYSSHCTDNMACLVAGRAGGLHPGLHIPAPGMHPANALITAMNAAGVPTTALGEVSGEIPGLRG